MHPEVRRLFNHVSSALLQQELDAMRSTRSSASVMWDAAGHQVYVTRASILAELEMRSVEEQLPWEPPPSTATEAS